MGRSDRIRLAMLKQAKEVLKNEVDTDFNPRGITFTAKGVKGKISFPDRINVAPISYTADSVSGDLKNNKAMYDNAVISTETSEGKKRPLLSTGKGTFRLDGDLLRMDLERLRGTKKLKNELMARYPDVYQLLWESRGDKLEDLVKQKSGRFIGAISRDDLKQLEARTKFKAFKQELLDVWRKQMKTIGSGFRGHK